jgi:hypothetical protein
MAVQQVVQLRRMENSQPWGFRLKGGTDQGIPLHVEHVQPKGRAAASGLCVGDLVVAISGAPTQSMSHGQVKSEMLRAGNELDLTVLRDGSLTTSLQPVPQHAAAAAAEPRAVIDEQPIPKLGGPTFKKVVPKTYQVLEGQLGSAEEEAAGEPAVKPASIFDRKREERSDYLKAKGNTIQKAYGE